MTTVNQIKWETRRHRHRRNQPLPLYRSASSHTYSWYRKIVYPPILAILLSIRNANLSMAVILGFGVLVTINWIDWFALGIQVSLNNIFICAWRQVFKGSTCFRSPMGLIIGDDNRSLSTSDTSATLGSNANNVNFFDITINDDESAAI